MSDKATVSLKGSGKDALWIVLNGTSEEMVQLVKDIFNFPEEETQGLDPVELFVNADSTLKALTAVGGTLGGQVIKDRSTEQPAQAKPDAGWLGKNTDPTQDAWEAASRAQSTPQAPAPQEAVTGPENGPQEPVTTLSHPYGHVIDSLKACKSLAELKGVWEKEQRGGYTGWVAGAFKNEDVMEAYRKVGRALKQKESDG